MRGPQAFPERDETSGDSPGMSLRDYFAAKALAGMIAACANSEDWPMNEIAATRAYEYADALLAVRGS